MSPVSAVAFASRADGDREPGERELPNATRPLAFYRPGQTRGREPSFRRLVLALQPGQVFDHARRLTAALTRSRALSIDLICLVDGFTEIFVAQNPVLLADPDGYVQRIGDMVQTLATRVRTFGVTCSATVLVGSPALELVRHLDRTDADLLLLGRAMHGADARLRERQWRPLVIRTRLT